MPNEPDGGDDKRSWEYPEPQHPEPAESRQTVREELTEAAQEMAHPFKTDVVRPRVADDLLLLFGRLAAVILFSVVLLTAVLALVRPEKDLAGVYNLLNTQLSLIIGAVLGYAAHPVEKD
jgi:hypothetical protein